MSERRDVLITHESGELRATVDLACTFLAALGRRTVRLDAPGVNVTAIGADLALAILLRREEETPASLKLRWVVTETNGRRNP